MVPTLAETDALVVTGTGRSMHLAKTIHHYGGGPPDADALCGRKFWEVYHYPLEDEDNLPWDLCRVCAKKRAET